MKLFNEQKTMGGNQSTIRQLKQAVSFICIIGTYLGLFLSASQSFGAIVYERQNESTKADKKAIETTLNEYMDGTSYNRPEQIARAFHKDALLYLEKRDGSQWHVPAKDYVSLFEGKIHNQFNGRIGEILSIEVDGRIATARLAIIIPKTQITYIDQILLKKFANSSIKTEKQKNQWQIISKSAVLQKEKGKQEQASAPRNGKRILFIASSARVHGDSDIPAGVSFSEIVKAWKTFVDAGYTVDFVSPDGGALSLSYINYRDDFHMQHLYTPDFMYAIGNSKTPQEIDPADYVAVHYLGGSNAMYGVAENLAIQNITMEIYEQHGGIVSAVCHGTAGIVDLKTTDGEYLVKDKRISSYPESYEHQDKPYFKEFPFLIQQTIEQRGGKFFHGSRNTAHIEVDGRIVTGQNHLSSEGVAKEMIRILEM